ncbi:hypothetical protein [Jeotgalibacillus salarius]|uniref:Uncharacterized protein n=1 Tax=Jeotgalibacillus salarius TaxID=546023 RepID=A0A4Y8LHK9_9BACL|nr:hypothetical protein [Jeotgalibacillus salarius]TFE02316.1 hypothetical protein E2626_06985 [Jeotgalibacillus salarius]
MKKFTEHTPVVFEQARADSKIFRTEYPLSKELRRQFIKNVYGKLDHYVLKQSVTGMYPDFLKFARICEARPEKEEHAAQLFYWWRLLNDAHKNPSSNIFSEFHYEHFTFFKKHPIFLSWLNLAKQVCPDFYYVAEGITPHSCYLIQLKDRKIIKMMLPGSNQSLPQNGTVISATLLPFSSQLHLPIAMYQFEEAATEDIVAILKHFHIEMKDEIDPYQVWLKIFKSLLLVEKYSLSGEEPWKK